MNYKTTLRIIVTGLLFGFSITDASAQVVQKIGQNSFTINPKAVLELESTSKGFLPPRMSTSNQSAMGTSLPDGLVVFITDGSSPGLQIWKDNKWIVFVDTDALALKANVADLTAETSRAQGAESINATAIALNTLKVGYTDALVAANTAVLANTAKVGISELQATDITANNAKVGISAQQVLDITANNAKTGITSQQATEISANTLKVGYTDALVAANTAVLANTAKVGINAQQASDITANNAKVGISAQQVLDITANNAKTGITSQQATEISANTLKVGYTDALVAANTAVLANTAKVGISAQQASDITANNTKIGISVQQVLDITANNAKTGITSQQATEISANTSKVGYTDALVAANTAVLANTAKVGISEQQATDITANNAKTGITKLQSDAIAANTSDILLKENADNKSASITLASNSDIKFPTEKAVIDYVDIKISTISIAKHTIAYTALASDNTILCDTSNGTFKLSLPSASETKGKAYVIRKTDTSNIALTFSELILVDGSTVTTLNYPKTLRVQSDGIAWYVTD